MGCVHSTPEEEKQPAPSGGSSSPNGTGDKSPNGSPDTSKRRLSVAPQHATLSATNGAPARGEAGSSHADDQNLSPIERQARNGMKHAVMSRKGLVPYHKNKVNQDRFVFKYGLGDDPSVSMWGVMDGHGEYGHYVAAFVQEHLPQCLASEKNMKKDPEGCITRATAAMCKRLADTDINTAFSGSTLVFGVRVDDTLYVANVGDSRCVLCRQGPNGQPQAIPLSIDQKPERADEKARILAAGGRVEPLPGPPGECGPARVWLAEANVPGLAMCLKEGTLVALADGSSIACENIKVGMELMGDEGQAVTVTDAQLNYSTDMYTVHTLHGTPYTVTADHRLTLRCKETGELFEMTAKEFARQFDEFSQRTTGARCSTWIQQHQQAEQLSRPSTPPSPTHTAVTNDPLVATPLKAERFTPDPWVSISKESDISPARPQRIMSLEVSGNHRYVLDSGIITHNSRSIGDEVSQTVGVISVPEITPHPLKENDIFVVWASDGVFEFLSDETVVKLIWKHKDQLQEAANQLVEESTKQWKREEEVIDDITCIIVQFNEPK